MITVKADIRVAEEYLRQFASPGRELARVIGRTLNRTGAKAKTLTSRNLRQRINLRKSVIDQSISVRRSNEIQNMSALTLGRAWFELRWGGKPVPLRDYAANETTRGVSFKVSKRGRRKVYVRQGRKGFMIEKLGNHVFVRVGPDPPGPKKAPIKKVFGPSVPQFAVTARERTAIIREVQEFWAVELQRNARFALARRGAY